MQADFPERQSPGFPKMSRFKKQDSSRSASVAQLDARPTGDQEVSGSTPPDWQLFFIENDHKIFSTVILSFPLIQEGQLSVSGERMCTILVYRLED